MNSKDIYLRCDDHAECAVFSRHGWREDDIDYEFTIEDSYCCGDYMGIKGRFKRAWKAFWAKPIYHTGVYCEDGKRMRKFLEDCLKLMDENNSNKKKCKDCDWCRKGWFPSSPEAYACIGVQYPFVIDDIEQECTEYSNKE